MTLCFEDIDIIVDDQLGHSDVLYHNTTLLLNSGRSNSTNVLQNVTELPLPKKLFIEIASTESRITTTPDHAPHVRHHQRQKYCRTTDWLHKYKRATDRQRLIDRDLSHNLTIFSSSHID